MQLGVALQLAVFLIRHAALLCLSIPRDVHATAETRCPENHENLSILLIGNSYSAGLAGMLQEMLTAADKLASRSVVVEGYTPGGATFLDHVDAARPVTGSQLSEHLSPPSTTAWDWVVLQDQSRIPGLYEDEVYGHEFALSLRAVTRLDVIIRNQTGASTLFFETWGRRDGDAFAIYPDFFTMQERLSEGYRRYAEATTSSIDNGEGYDCGVPRIVKVGTAFRYVYESLVASSRDPLAPDSMFVRLYAPDGSHPSDYGRYLAICVFYASLTGLDPRHTTWIPAGLLLQTEDDEAYVGFLQSAAAHVVFGGGGGWGAADVTVPVADDEQNGNSDTSPNEGGDDAIDLSNIGQPPSVSSASVTFTRLSSSSLQRHGIAMVVATTVVVGVFV